MDYISQIECCLREEMKARMSQSQSNPVFGNADGTCFSCGRSPTNSAFPPMPVRSPKNSAGGGFKATPKKRLKMSASMKALRAMEPRGPSAMEKAVSLPHLPGSGDVAPSTIVEEVHAPLATQPPTDPMKLPPVDSTSRPEDAQVEV